MATTFARESAESSFKKFGIQKGEITFSAIALHEYRQLPAHRFAVLKFGGESLDNRLPEIAEGLAFISQCGLTPVVIHGGGKQIDENLAAAGIPVRKQNGIRVTDAPTMRIVAGTLNSLTNDIVGEILLGGGKAVNANGMGIVSIEQGTKALGFVGRIRNVDTQNIKRICAGGVIPVFASFSTFRGQAYNINADTLAAEFALRLKPENFYLITERGGVRKDSTVIQTIRIGSELNSLVDSGVVSGGMRLKLEELAPIIRKNPRMSVEICSPENLLPELLGWSGRGTRLTLR